VGGPPENRQRAENLANAAVAVVAGNLADADVLDKLFLPEASGGLGYMLHHRGYSHTIIGSGLIGFAVAVATWAFCRRFLPPRALVLLLGIGVCCSELHLLFDGFVDYGVHPFFPWNQWVYGDFLFLGEPLLWALSVPIFASAGAALARPGDDEFRRKLLLYLAGAACAWYLFNAFSGHWISAGAAAFAIAMTLAALGLQFGSFSPRGTVIAICVVCLIFLGGSLQAKSIARHEVARSGTGERVRHVVSTPAPANPLCWRIITSGYDESGTQVRVRVATVSLAPSIVDARTCLVTNRVPPPTAKNVMSWTKATSPRWNWIGLFAKPADDFSKLAEGNCMVKKTRSFLRAPFWIDSGCGSVVGDLRFDYSTDPEKWAKYTFEKGDEPKCDAVHSPWIAPFFD